MKPYQIKPTYKCKQYQFAMLSNETDIHQSLKERFPGCECEVVGPDVTMVNNSCMEQNNTYNKNSTNGETK